jgi:hypothetical protein
MKGLHVVGLCALVGFVGCLSGIWVLGCSFSGLGVLFYSFCRLLRVSFGCFLRILPVYLGVPLRFFLINLYL